MTLYINWTLSLLCQHHVIVKYIIIKNAKRAEVAGLERKRKQLRGGKFSFIRFRGVKKIRKRETLHTQNVSVTKEEKVFIDTNLINRQDCKFGPKRYIYRNQTSIYNSKRTVHAAY